ncbi:hypothetical protein SAMD00019534_014540 [Acytostelium subglobosum LB1]|uniref:hypothetical protein n=1 Tax=Acytostelium subglobosum LB1 TaxID=1410327 RepID=UPI000644C534|nr:hypothetical protein SAMD00019534_014540 [Acytostelium subglobosum LB1]GAM18279.1 hypothetical protein SAMD00019534_014540 [Acytostelium subglobosum LB1]|eukprot:XP_012758875.1 hypothetical protein SAMD00019534_014540 [Acytostelium subglobosum LB1]
MSSTSTTSTTSSSSSSSTTTLSTTASITQSLSKIVSPLSLSSSEIKDDQQTQPTTQTQTQPQQPLIKKNGSSLLQHKVPLLSLNTKSRHHSLNVDSIVTRDIDKRRSESSISSQYQQLYTSEQQQQQRPNDTASPRDIPTPRTSAAMQLLDNITNDTSLPSNRSGSPTNDVIGDGSRSRSRTSIGRKSVGPALSYDAMDLLDQIVSESLMASPSTSSVKSDSITPDLITPRSISTPTLASPALSSTPDSNRSGYQQITPDRVRKQMSFPVFGSNSSCGNSPRIGTPMLPSRSSIAALSNSPVLVSRPVVVKNDQQTTQDIWRSTLSSRPKEELIKVCFDEVPGKKITQRFSIDMTPLEIKTKLLEEVGQDYMSIVDQFELKVLSINLAFTNESLPLRRQLVMQACNITRLFPRLQLAFKCPGDGIKSIDPEAIDIKSHVEAELEIFNLIGNNHTRFLDNSKSEVVKFRREMAHYRLVQPTPTNHLTQYIYVLSEPMPLVIPPRITIQVTFPNSVHITKKLHCDPNQTVTETLNDIYRKYSVFEKVSTKDMSPIDFVLKVTGFSEFILSVPQLGTKTVEEHRIKPSGKDGDFSMLDYDYIRSCISKQQIVELTFSSSSILAKQAEPNISFIDKLLDTNDFDSDGEDELSAPFEPLVEGVIVQSPPQQSISPSSQPQSAQQGIFSQQQNTAAAAAANGRFLPITRVNRLFRIKLVGLRNINLMRNEEARTKFVDRQLYGFVMVELYHGGEPVSSPVFSSAIPLPSMETINFPDWERDVWTPFNISIRSLPRATRACLTFFVTSEQLTDPSESKSIPIGWANYQLINHKGYLCTGPVALRLWEDGRANPIGTCIDNLAAKTPTILLIEFETFVKPVVFVPPDYDQLSPRAVESRDAANQVKKTILEPAEARRLKLLMQSDALMVLQPEDKRLIYNHRHLYVNKPKALAKFLSGVNWVEMDQTLEAYRHLQEWAALRPTQALELLDAKFADSNVRSYAIAALNCFTDAEFSDFLLQLTQVLKYEPYHMSDLTNILIQRSLSNTSRIGHPFFWFLKAELDTPEIEERYSLLLEGYLRSCGSHRQELIKQDSVINMLLTVANSVKTAQGTSEKKKVLFDGLSKLKLPDRFQLPLDPRWEAKGLIVDKCKYMDSKKLPLWLVFENAEPFAKPLTVIFKVGDDLRQDILTLQVIRIMDKIWKSCGLDLRLQPYKCVATGNGVGMIEVVLNANTIANINKDAGGTGALLEEKTLDNWLRDCNPGDADYNKAVETFILSCAGYVVATYVLGIGDRHADNIMITKAGHLFHIDFGHFLGNYKKKYGFKRERAPFIFTPQYMAIVGGKDSDNFKFFVQTCCLAYNTLRKHTDLFINLFQLMLSTGIPELRHADDIDYLRKALAPDSSDVEAAKEFTNNIHVALNTKTVLLNDIFHNWAH